MFGRNVGLLLGITLVAAAVGGWMLSAGAEEDGHEEEGASGLLSVFETLVGDLVPPSKALAAALGDHAWPVTVLELDTEQSDGRKVVVWEVEYIRDGKMFECVVDARSGKVLETEDEGDEDEAEEYLSHLKGAAVSASAAVKTVETTIDGRILAVELDDEDGILVYEFMLLANGRLTEIMVRLDNGKIMLDDDEDDEDEDEDEDED